MNTTNRPRRHDTHSRRWIQGSLLAVVGGATLGIIGAVWTSANNGDENTNVAISTESVVIDIPVAKAPQVAAGVRVSEPAVDRGKLPLNTTVSQVYELVNTGSGTAKLGEPTIEVLDGCCPPEPQLSQNSIAAGEKALVAVSMQMHPGMDGPHLFHMTVPVQSPVGEDALHLYFKGDFGG